MKAKLVAPPTTSSSLLRKGVIAIALTAALSRLQGQSIQPEKIAADIEKVKQGALDAFTIAELARAGASQAITPLEAAFDRATDTMTKAQLASALVRLGDKNGGYWNFLAAQATVAAESDAPDLVFDSQGNGTPGKLSPNFVQWAKDHNMAPNDAGLQVTYEFGPKIVLLGATGDSRAIPILQRALSSRNHPIIVEAAAGLATLQDKASIPLIIAACQRVPASAAEAIAAALVYFDDPEAQRAVDTYMPKEHARAAREARSNGMKPFGY